MPDMEAYISRDYARSIAPKGVGFPPAEIQTKGKDYIAVKTPEYGTGGGGEKHRSHGRGGNVTHGGK